MPLVAASVVAATGIAAAAASAQGPAVIVRVHQASGLVSPYFQLSASAAKTVTAGSLEVVNPTSRTVKARLDPVDAITTNTLGSAYAQTSSAVHGAATWLQLGRRLIVIPRHSSTRVSVVVAVPAGAAPGDYLGGVSVEALGQSQTTKVTRGVAIGQTERYAIGVEVKLPGARHPVLSFTGAAVGREPAGLTFNVNASNTGNVILKNVHGWVRVTSGDRVVSAATIQPGTFVSGTSISYPVRASREEPAPGSSYRVRAVLRYAGGIAHLDTRVVFSHAAAVKQQNYGGRKLPNAGPPWRWLVPLLLLLAAVPVARQILLRRRRPLSRDAGLKLLERHLGPTGNRPVSVALVSCDRRAAPAIAHVVRSRLRRTDRVCALGREGLLVICPATTRRAANALKQDLEALLALHPRLADTPIQITLATANKPTTAQKLLGRVSATPRRHREPAVRPRRRQATTTVER